MGLPRTFQTTRWSLVKSVREGNEAATQFALEQLCSSYWYPIYAFIRSTGKGPQDAEDLTQGFFANLLKSETLADADSSKGKLRTFLLTCARRYIGDEWQKAMAQKRGARLLVNIKPEWAEGRYATEPVDNLTPDRLFQRRWALTVLEFSLGVLEEEHRLEGPEKDTLFQQLRPFLGLKSFPEQRYDAVAASLNMPLGTVKSHVSRLRKRWRDILFEQVSATLSDTSPESVRAELAELMECV